MKTLQAIKDEVAKSKGFSDWKDLVQYQLHYGLINRDHDEAAKIYAKQVAEQALKDAAERAGFIHHCGRTKRNKSLKYIQLGCDNIKPDQQSILTTEIKLP